jgi:adenosylhomocysteine nucleosidase
MLLRYLVNTWIRQAAQEKLQEAVTQFAESARATPDQANAEANEEPTETPAPCAAAVIFALDVESGGLVDRLSDVSRRRYRTRKEHDGSLEGRRVLVVEGGVGMDAAARAVEKVIAKHQPPWIVSAGFAGALTSDLRRGNILMAEQIVDETGQEFDVGLKMDPATVAATRGLHVGRLLTVDRIIHTAAEKRSLGERYRAVACDMETAAIAEACRQRKTRFLSVRVISDAVDDELPPEIEALVQQKTTAARLGAAAGAIFRRPSSVKDMWRLKEEAIKASDRLAKFLEGVLRQL